MFSKPPEGDGAGVDAGSFAGAGVSSNPARGDDEPHPIAVIGAIMAASARGARGVREPRARGAYMSGGTLARPKDPATIRARLKTGECQKVRARHLRVTPP